MKWVATREEMPEVGRRVLCAMYADTEYGFPVCGFFDGEYWIVDDVQQLIDPKRVHYWAPIARIQKEDRKRGPETDCVDGNDCLGDYLLVWNHVFTVEVIRWTLSKRVSWMPGNS